MFRRKNRAAVVNTVVLEMLKEKPLEMYRTDKLLAMYAPGIDRVIIVTGNNSSMSEGECLKQLVLATREHHEK